jgi:HSP20 family protein
MGKGEWNQWRGMDEFREQMDRMLDAAQHGPASTGAPGVGYVWMPLADIVETDQALVVRIELPGISSEQVVVEIADGALVVRGERPADCDDADTVYHLLERAHGAFARRFPLPEDTDGEAIKAVLREGLLTVTVSRRRASRPLRRTVQLG